jgi:hypothetical protein
MIGSMFLTTLAMADDEVVFPKKINQLPYMKYQLQDSSKCKDAISLVNNSPSLADFHSSKLRFNIHSEWLEADSAKWTSGCLNRHTKAEEFKEFISYIKQNQKTLSKGKNIRKFKADISRYERELKSTTKGLTHLDSVTSRVTNIKNKVKSCEAYENYSNLKFINNAENNFNFFTGLCLEYREYIFDKSLFNDKITLTVSKLSMNNEHPISFSLVKNENDIWEADSYSGYHLGNNYSISRTWNSARSEIAIIGARKYGQDLLILQQSQSLDILKEAVNSLQSKISNAKNELEKLAS